MSHSNSNLSAVENLPEISTVLKSIYSLQCYDKAIVVQVFFGQDKNLDDLQEFLLLADSAKVNVLYTITTSRTAAPQAKYFVGEGKAQEIAEAAQQYNADIVLINHQLSPAQSRNLENLCQCRIIDRTGLILDIFAQRARTHEGKLQVELAQLKHLSTRLIKRKIGLDQQKGTVGLRGPGETQLETDRRLIKIRISQLQKRLEKVAKQRNQNRQTRQKAGIPTLSLVGYTNSGKSTLFNRLTQSDVYAADQLFATLDPTLRRLQLEHIGTCILADTVGFVRQLPHDLISAFKSTLQETSEAALLLHVIDFADLRKNENIETVNLVLEEINAHQIPTLLIYNKIDKIEGMEPHIEYNDENQPIAVYLSAQSGIGMQLLTEAIYQRLKHDILSFQLTLSPKQGRIRHQLYLLDCIQLETISERGEFILDIQIEKIQWLKLQKHFPNLISKTLVNTDSTHDLMTTSIIASSA
ncbi:ribosome rescue GTPase HflX [Rodentibacter caecimuris]|uniref:GTPase HflX n=1 Tax=Rodentibacter caecimuris TaxID=1796644 RepID=A0ABX3KYW4_9PAST|nr:GTPase HflX [Rodentibacter heylii]